MNKKKALQMILNNAKISIKLGVIDYGLSKKEKIRKISSIRNLLAGILLLYKYKLVLLSEGEDPFEYIRKNTKNNQRGVPKTTIYTKDIIDKLKGFNIFVNEDLLDAIVHSRNDIEHLFNASNVDISNVVNNAFSLISDFITTHLKNVGYIQFFLGNDIYKILLENKTIVESRKEKCDETFYKYIDDFPSYELYDYFLEIIDCPKCKSNFIKFKKGIYPKFELFCDHCSSIFSLDDFLHTTHIDIKNGGDFRSSCYECGAWSLIYGACWLCGFVTDPNIDYEREMYLEYLANKDD